MLKVTMGAVIAGLISVLHGPAAWAADMTWVRDGRPECVIVVSENTPRPVKQAAHELVEYVEKITGASLEIIEGLPDPLPEHAVWVGPHPQLSVIFPNLDFHFKQPEEILIACDGRNLVITGDGTSAANAVYTFLQDYLDVRWLWPGPLGEDVIQRETVAFKPFEYRFHPPIRQRDVFRWNPRAYDRDRVFDKNAPLAKIEADWTRYQRKELNSLFISGFHAFGRWWERYHDEHPDYFALQPDGTRSAYPSTQNVKLCESNPDVWEQWVQDWAVRLPSPDSNRKNLPANAGDGHSSGICMCTNCMAWDHPGGLPWTYKWAHGVTREYVAMSDRYVRFFNQLGRKLKERFPERSDLMVGGGAYGPSMPPPVEAVADDNVIISFVGFFPLSAGESSRREQKANMLAWSEKSSLMHYRPNMLYCAGGIWGFPEIAMDNAIEDFRFLADVGCVGIAIDSIHGHWATQGPQYYLMTQLAWNPRQDGHALMDDYYRRGFGPAAADLAEYWKLMETARERLVESPDYQFGSAYRLDIIEVMMEAYSDALLSQADAALKRAELKTADASDLYRQRVAFVRSGLDFICMMKENVTMMARVRATGGRDFEAVHKVVANWVEIERVCRDVYPFALNFEAIIRQMESSVYMGQVGTHFGPPMQGWVDAALAAERDPEAASEVEFKMVSAEESGWELAFTDDFSRDKPGPEWRVVDGDWSLKEGLLTGSGMIQLARAFPGFQRLEFKAEAIEPVPGAEVDYISDLSSVIHAQPEGKPLSTGYFFQFGGQANTKNAILRKSQHLSLDVSPKNLIQPGKPHQIVVENDYGHLRLIVDGKLLLETKDPSVLAGAGQDRIGFFIYTPANIWDVKVYVKPLQDDFI